MAHSRDVGKRYGNNLINMAIMLFLRNKKRSTTEIRDFLNKDFGVGQSRGIRNHLDHLENEGYVVRNTKVGIGTEWEWAKNVEPLKKIVNFLEHNKTLIEKVLEKSISLEQIKKEGMTSKIGQTVFVESTFDHSVTWFNTKYVQSFLNKKTLKEFIKKAYSKYFLETKGPKLDKGSFQNAVLGSVTMESLISFMHYSPSLAYYFVNMQDNYDELMQDVGRVGMGKVMLIVLKDSLILRRGLHAGNAVASYGLEKINESNMKGWNLDLTCFLPNLTLEGKNANS